MKINLFFDSKNEFAEFILSASSIHFGSKFQEMKDRNFHLEFLELVYEVGVERTRYSVVRASFGQKAEYTIINYMLNDVQIENDSVYFTNDRGGGGNGSQDVRNLLAGLPESFVLRVGWRTDYEEFIFSKS